MSNLVAYFVYDYVYVGTNADAGRFISRETAISTDGLGGWMGSRSVWTE
jgi:hypothetical protein